MKGRERKKRNKSWAPPLVLPLPNDWLNQRSNIFGWLIDSLIHWSLVKWYADSLIFLTDLRTDELTSWRIDRQTDRQTGQLANWSTCWPMQRTDWQTDGHGLKDWLTDDRLTNVLTDRQTDRQIDRLNYWLTYLADHNWLRKDIFS